MSNEPRVTAWSARPSALSMGVLNWVMTGYVRVHTTFHDVLPVAGMARPTAPSGARITWGAGPKRSTRSPPVPLQLLRQLHELACPLTGARCQNVAKRMGNYSCPPLLAASRSDANSTSESSLNRDPTSGSTTKRWIPPPCEENHTVYDVSPIIGKRSPSPICGCTGMASISHLKPSRASVQLIRTLLVVAAVFQGPPSPLQLLGQPDSHRHSLGIVAKMSWSQLCVDAENSLGRTTKVMVRTVRTIVYFSRRRENLSKWRCLSGPCEAGGAPLRPPANPGLPARGFRQIR